MKNEVLSYICANLKFMMTPQNAFYVLFPTCKRILKNLSLILFVLTLSVFNSYGQYLPTDDFDSDGVLNYLDIDDDNDGILDETESPECFMSEAEAVQIDTVTTEFVAYLSHVISNAYDGDLNTESIFDGGQSFAGKTLYEITPAAPLALVRIDIDAGLYHISSDANSTFQLEGYDGTNWVVLSAPMSQTTATDFSIFNTNQPNSIYEKFRIQGVAGTSYYPSVVELTLVPIDYNNGLYPVVSCTADIDGDNIMNHFDLDSDGDGCSDLAESGAGLIGDNLTSQSTLYTGVGANGLADHLETGTDNDTINYNYQLYAYNSGLNACSDADNDGIGDLIDIDDDNDGIPDIMESMACFFTETEAAHIDTIITEFNQYSTYTILNAADGNVSTQSGFSPGQSLAGKTLYEVKPTTAIAISELHFDMGSWYISTNVNSTFQLEGYDGSSWVVLSAPMSNTSTADFSIVNTLHPNAVFEKFRIQGVAGTCYYAGVYEITLVPNNYVASQHPKPSCTEDEDGDGLLNHLDLDSDGDGCPDLTEANAGVVGDSLVTMSTSYTSVGLNGLADHLETGTDNGSINYNYTVYAYIPGLNACTDTDNDGIGDLADIDDDNDGVVDAVESPGCYYTEAEVVGVDTITTEFTQYSSYVLTNSYDGNTGTQASFNSGPLANKTLFEITTFGPFAINELQIDAGSWAFSSNANSTFRLEGFNGSSWVALSTPMAQTTATDFSLINTLQPNTIYEKFRIQGVAGSAYYPSVKEFTLVPNNYVASLNPKNECFSDIDGDGIFNHHDLDSDGDGCSDLTESGAGALGDSLVTQDAAYSSVGANGLADHLESSVDSDSTIFTMQPFAYSNTSACIDTDNDGVEDVFDIDDDNDGILDVVELVNCFDGSIESGDRESLLTVTTNLAMGACIFPQTLADGITNDTIIEFGLLPNQDITDANPVMFSFGEAVCLETVYLRYPFDGNVNHAHSHFDPGSVVKLQGSLDNSSWIDLNDGLTYGQNPPLITVLDQGQVYAETYPVTKNSSEYRYYRLRGVSGSTNSTGLTGSIELYVDACSGSETLSVCTPSMNDLDEDGIPNHLDLDSDDDGCPDAFEANINTTHLQSGTLPDGAAGASTTFTNGQVSGSYGANGLADGIESDDSETATVNNNSYTSGGSNYIRHALVNLLNACTDTDNDGIGDLADIDDDNDGVADAIESPSCYYSEAEASHLDTIITELNKYSSYVIGNAIDGNVNTQSAFAWNQNIVGKTLYELRPAASFAISGVHFDMGSWQISRTASSTFQLEGFDGSSWVALSLPVAKTNTTDFTLANTIQPNTVFEKYRIQGVAGTSHYAGVKEITLVPNNYVASLNPKNECFSDIDGDGIFNHHDLDSDGDGCSDLTESGAGALGDSLVTQDATYSSVGANGLADHLESSVDSDSTIFTMQPFAYSNTSACIDTDNDGVEDVFDIDDDNDGILDVVELVNCFDGSIESGDRESLLTVTTNLAMGACIFPQTLADGITNDTIIEFGLLPNQDITDANPVMFSFGEAVCLETVYLRYPFDGNVNHAHSHFDPGSVVKLQGSLDNSSWIDLNDGLTYGQNPPFITVLDQGQVYAETYPVTKNSSEYRYYRLRGVSGSTNNTGLTGSIELYVDACSGSETLSVCTPSMNDLDEDGIPNHLDLDSDGDGCYDIAESGAGAIGDSLVTQDAAYSSVGANGLADNLETTTDSDSVNYILTPYTYTATLNVCADSDNDGVNDLVDIDDDNDGILDAVESPDCFFTEEEASHIDTIITELNKYSTYEIYYAIDGNVSTQSAFAWNQNIVGKTLYELKPVAPIAISGVHFDMGSWQISRNASSTFRLEGFNGSSWIALSLPVAKTNTTDFTLANTVQPNTVFEKYRIQGVAGTSHYAGVKEITLVPNNYLASLNPKSSCGTDLDGDGIVNHLDLDSDGDGCYDIAESGAGAIGDSLVTQDAAYSSVGANGLADNLETSTDSDSVNYVLTPYTYTATLNVCADSDNDGVSDLVDIDDDNDGIVDAVESPDCYFTEDEATQIDTITTELNKYSSYVIGNAIDDNVSTQSAFAYNQNMVGKTLYEIKPIVPLAISGVHFDMGSWQISLNASSTFRLEGFDGSSWIALSLPVAKTNTTDFTLANTVQPNTIFEKFRIQGVAGSSHYAGVMELELIASSFISSAYPKSSCESDLDGDGIVNHLDLDSDGDGCYDLIESGAGAVGDSVVTQDAAFSSVGLNGLADNLETSADSDTTSYDYTYYAYSSVLNFCADSDNDGINDLVDVDDDNDGVLDAAESPDCFFTEGEARAISNVTSELTIHSSYVLANSFDGATGTQSRFNNGQSLSGKTLFEITPSIPLAISALNVDVGSWYISSNTNSTFRLEGFNGAAWIALSLPMSNTSTADFSISNTVQPNTIFEKYRIQGVAGTCYHAGVSELSLVANNYIASRNPKSECLADLDQDGIFNHLDLDSDGDGCSDLGESGAGAIADSLVTQNPAFSSVGANGFADNLESSVDSDEISYDFTFFAYTSVLNACADSDNDGVNDLVDIDDDNDGILDAVESPNCYFTKQESEAVDTITTEFTQYSSYVLTNSYDGLVNTQSAFQTGQDLAGKTLYEIIPVTPVAISAIHFDMGSWKISSNASSTFRLEGFNGGGWVALSAPMANNSTADFSISNAIQPNTVFAKFRLQGVAGTTSYAGVKEITLVTNDYVASEHPKNACVADLDNDGIFNHLDLDSDGDGCSDLAESGAGIVGDSLVTESASYTGVGLNGLADHLETSPESDSVNYSFNYYVYYATINACTDTDNDGIGDLVDIDDDNDGIIDTDEYKVCFSGSVEEGNRIDNISVTTDLNLIPGRNIPESLVDGVQATSSTSQFRFSAGQTIANQDAIKISFPEPVCVEDLYLRYPTTTTITWIPVKDLPPIQVVTTTISSSLFTNNSVLKLQGSQDDVTWVDLNNGVTYGQQPSLMQVLSQGSVYAEKYPVDFGSNPYKYYRITGVSGSTRGGDMGAIELYVDACSGFENIVVCPDSLNDYDGDGIPNPLDLDSDGDGCPDAVEAGIDVNLLQNGSLPDGTSGTVTNFVNGQVTGAYGNNGLANSIESDDSFSATVNSTTYPSGVSSYDNYALNDSINACTDTDGDQVADLFDIDDDNDGILDVIELTAGSTGTIDKSSITVSSDLSWSQSVQTTVDGNVSSNLFSSPGGQNIAGQTYLEFNFNTPILLSEIELQCVAQGLVSNGSTWKVQGSTTGANWTDVSSVITSTGPQTGIVTATTYSENFVVNPAAAYQFYRIQGISGTTINWYLREAHFTGLPLSPLADYDNDGILNSLDLDSDGDGCPDCMEAGITISNLQNATFPDGVGGLPTTFTNGQVQGAYGANGLANGIENNDLITAIVVAGAYNTGVSTYNPLALDSTDNTACCPLDNSSPIVEAISPDSCSDGNMGIINISNIGMEPGTSYFVSYLHNGTLVNLTSDPTSATSVLTLNNLQPGTYTNITVTSMDYPSCLIVLADSAVITPFVNNTIAISETHLDVTCNGLADGEITLTVTGGTTPYDYAWNSGQTTSFIDELMAGLYIVTVTDADGCEKLDSITITEPVVLDSSTINVSTVNATCNGDNDGSATVTPTGGTAPYTYLWSDGQTTATASNLSAGVYTVLVTDANNCSFDMSGANSIVITEPAVLDPSTIAVNTTNVSCNGLSDGSATVTPTGGTAPYTYLWSNGQTTATASNLSAGVYTVLVTDANNCSFNMNGANSIVITEPAVLDPSTIAVSITSPICNGDSDGSATVTPTGGTAPYTYLWSDGQTTATASNLVAGTYTVLVTDANNCSFNMNGANSIVITEPAVLDSSTISVSITNVSCNGDSNGSATVTPTGGTAPYTYLWSDGQTTATASNLVAGTYTVLVTDANNCSFNMNGANSIVITEPAVLDPSTISVNISNVSCNGLSDGSATVTPTGGTAPYTYLWSDGQTTATASNLVAGTYTVLITDANNCSFNMNGANSIVITEPAVLDPSTIAVSITNPTCNGDSDGSATVTPTGGTAPYTYLWSDGQTTATASNLVAGTYTVLVTDANNCSFNMNGANSITITEPAVLDPSTISVSITHVSCNGDSNGSATVTPTGGTAPYTYLWSDGQTTATASNLAAGTYTVLVTDANNCSFNMNGANSIVITESTILDPSTIAVSITTPTCNGDSDGSATVTPTGGTAPYTYLWSDGQTTATASNLVAGTYTVLITDANNCSFNMDGANSIVITEPAVLDPSTIAVSITTPTCNGDSDGSATVTPTGGTAPYTYLWSDGQTTATASNLVAGTYTVLVTDANNCSFNMNGANSIVITEPAVLDPSTIGVSITHVSCNGLSDGSCTVTPTGGTAPYTYLWSDGQTTATASNLVAGTYTVLVTDANNCSFNMNGANSIVVTEPAVLDASTIGVSITNVSCNGLSDGSCTVTPTGGTAPYTYLWSDGQTTATASNLAAGTYTVLVTDANNCSFNMNGANSITITEPAVLDPSTISVSITNVSCNGLSDGSATVTPTGGTAPYTYLWSDGQTTATASNLVAGTYTVLVTDANNCSFNMNGANSIVITEPAVLDPSTIGVNITHVSCYGLSDGSVTLNVAGGTAPYTYLWSDGQTTATASNLVAGTYTVLVTDANNCSFNMNGANSITITEPTAIVANTSTTDASCNGGTDGSAMVAPTGGAGSYTYLWSDGQTTATAINLVAGTYSVTITDADNCTLVESPIVVSQATTLTSEGFAATDVSCYDACDGTAAISADGGVPPYTYLWSDGQTTQVATGLCADTYSVVITDANNCTYTQNNIVVNQPDSLILTLTPTHILCNGDNTGSIATTVTGGTAPYTYLWSDGQTTDTAMNLVAGTYTVTVTDDNGCQIIDSVTVTEPPVLVNNSITITHPVCFGDCTGSISINVSGGVGPYTYDWSIQVINQIDGDGTPTIFNLCKGIYSVLVTDANGCELLIENIEISEPGPIFNDNIAITDVTCNGGSDGSIALSVLGGTAPYTYLWSDGQTTATATNLTAGVYSVTITDANNCVLELNTLAVNEPPALSNTGSLITDVTCNGDADGSIEVFIGGGTPPYNYLWDDPSAQTTATATGLVAGIYSVTVTDANNCVFVVDNQQVTQPAALVVTDTTITNASCFGECDGSISITVTDGTGPYTYAWSQIFIQQITGNGTPNVTELCKGLYSVTITDAQNCSITIDSLEITEPTPIFTNGISLTNVSCNGGSDGEISLDILGGVPPYTYAWSNGDNTSTISNLTAGTYSVTVTDANNCTYQENNIQINEPQPLNTQLAVDYTAATITASTTGGTAPYIYSWNTGSSGATISNLVDGITYVVTTTDDNNCTVVDSVTYVAGGGMISQMNVTIGPNPTINTTKMVITTPITARINVMVFDTHGKIVEKAYEGTMEADTVLELILLDEQWGSGTFFACVMAEDGSLISRKIILVK